MAGTLRGAETDDGVGGADAVVFGLGVHSRHRQIRLFPQAAFSDRPGNMRFFGCEYRSLSQAGSVEWLVFHFDAVFACNSIGGQIYRHAMAGPGEKIRLPLAQAGPSSDTAF